MKPLKYEMKIFGLIILLVFGAKTFGQGYSGVVTSPKVFIPDGYVVFQQIQGDLNKDHQEDYVFIIKGTNKANFVSDGRQGVLDRNRRGIIIALKNEKSYELVLENRDCFSSENEDGGVYFAPELDVSISKGNLILHYAHGRYGYWTYIFRYQNAGFELIGYDSSTNYGPITEKLVSINLMTKKMLIKENRNQRADVDADEQFNETWKKFSLPKPIKLKEITDFDEFDVTRLLRLIQ